jgi:putative phosphotransacetylase
MIAYENALRDIALFVVRKELYLQAGVIPVGVSNRHVHLSQRELEILFGRGYQLNPFKLLSQPRQYAASEKVDLIGPRGEIKGVRILGPVRKETQVEISFTDSFKLGLKPPVRDSGNLEGTPGIKLRGPEGEVGIPRGVIIAQRHLHLTPEDAEIWNLRDKELISVETFGERKLIFNNVLVRINANYFLELHLDTDEANSAGLKTGDPVRILK